MRFESLIQYTCNALTYGLLVGDHMHFWQHLRRDQRLVNLDERLIAIGANPRDLLAIAGPQTTAD